MALIIREFVRDKNVLLRGLAHPVLFNTTRAPSMSALGDILQTFGAVEVSPMNYYQLLKQNETILLFPGGAKEALHAKGQEYQLFW